MAVSRTRVLVEIALTIALCAVLHFFRVWQMPAGGTVSLEMLPIIVLGLRRGAGPALVAGALFGVVDYFLEPFVVHWIQFFLDYPIAFAAVGLAGLWEPLWRRLIKAGRASIAVAWVIPAAVVTGALARYVAHFVSGAVFFATVSGGGPLANGTSTFTSITTLRLAAVYSAIYNLYVPISAAACLVAALVLIPALDKVVPVEERA